MKLEDARNFWRSRGVPEEAIEDLWSCAEAARFNDATAEERESIESVLREAGWEPEAATYMAEQRAMRMLLSAHPQGAEYLRAFARKFDPGLVSGLSRPQLAAVAAVWLDGFAIAARASRLRED